MEEMRERTAKAKTQPRQSLPLQLPLLRSVPHTARAVRGPLHAPNFRKSYLVNVIKVADLIGIMLAGFSAHFFRFGADSAVDSSTQLFIYLSSIVTVYCLDKAGSYDQKPLQSIGNQSSKLFAGSTGAVVLILFCGFMSGALKEYSRIWIGMTMLMAGLILLTNRIVLIYLTRKAVVNGQWLESIIIVGANERAERIVDTIPHASESGIRILGVFDDRTERAPPAALLPYYLGTTDAMLDYIRGNRVDRVVVAMSWIASDRIDELLKKLRTVPVRIDLVPNNMIWQYPSIGMERVGGVPVVTIANGRVDEQSGLVKRCEDIAVSLLLLLLSLPLLLLIALAIRLDSPGPVLFRQKRHGFNNEIFNVYKFRTMYTGEVDPARLRQATANDPRVTRIGRLLRRLSLDELPQLFNVLSGDMSVVGPRPHAVQHNMEYATMISEYLARHNVKPGITGWAQVNGLRGETDTSDKMQRRVDSDLYYIEHWSLLLDLKIIFLTALMVWFQQNAY